MISSERIRVRPARPDDADAVAVLAHALGVHDNEPTGNFTPDTMRQAVFDDMAHMIFGEAFDTLAKEADDQR